MNFAKAASVKPSQSSMASGSAVGGMTGGRSWKQIVEEAEKKEILHIKITKTVDSANGTKPKNLTLEDLATFIFDVLKVDYNNCSALDLYSGRYDSRFIELKPGVEPTPYLRSEPVIYMKHEITVTSIKNRSTKVTFRNVPLNVPDEELLHLAYHYGTPVDNKVDREVLTNNKIRGMKGSTRFIHMNLDKGKSFQNYYWMEGPLPGDQGRRVVVTHPGQAQQCSHCLRRAGEGCPAAGNGKNCEAAETPRGQMKEYMQKLRTSCGYASLKVMNAESQARLYPSPYNSEPGFEGMVEEAEKEEDEPIVLQNPIAQRDKEIENKKEEVDCLKKALEQKDRDQKEMEESTDKINKMNEDLKLKLATATKQLNRSKVLLERKLEEKFENSDWDPEANSGFEITAMANLLTDEDIETVVEVGEERSKRGDFLTKLTKKIQPEDKEKMKKLEIVKNKIIERRLSLASSSPVRGRTESVGKRQNSDDIDNNPAKPKQRDNPSRLLQPKTIHP